MATKKTEKISNGKNPVIENKTGKIPEKVTVHFIRNYIGLNGIFVIGDVAEVKGTFADSLIKSKGAEKC